MTPENESRPWQGAASRTHRAARRDQSSTRTCPLPPATGDGRTLAAAIDRAYFAANPSRRTYRRPAIAGEFGPRGGNVYGAWVRVTRLAPGIQHKALVGGPR